MKYYLAIDIGASSGRHIIGYYKNNELVLDEVYLFKNSVIIENNNLIWNIDNIFFEVKQGIKKALEKYKHIESMSIDTWGVDYVLLNGDKVIYPVYSYRDDRTAKIIDKVHNLISFDELYKITGSQFQKFNTIYQLYDDLINDRLNNVTDFLMIPEYLSYCLTGVKKKEYTNASTTGMFDYNNNCYSKEIIEKLKFNKNLFKNISYPGEIVGNFKKEIIDEVGGNIVVKLCASHDTASAVEGIPMIDNNPYISSGTWSLLGLKIDHIINSNEAKNANYSNELGPNYVRFQKNIMGLWIIQNLAKQMNLDFATMVKMAKESEYNVVFDVNNPMFLSALDMKIAIKNYFMERKMILPKEDKDYINSTYISLAYSYKESLDELEKITNQKFDKLYIVGGGAKNQYLNDLTKDITQKKVIALPIEATAIGNLLIQMEEK